VGLDKQLLAMQKFDSSFDVPLKQLQPIIVGCTSEILSLQLLQQCDSDGFRMVCTSPMREQDLKTNVLPLVHKRQNAILLNNIDYMFSGKISLENDKIRRSSSRKFQRVQSE